MHFPFPLFGSLGFPFLARLAHALAHVLAQVPAHVPAHVLADVLAHVPAHMLAHVQGSLWQGSVCTFQEHLGRTRAEHLITEKLA